MVDMERCLPLFLTLALLASSCGGRQSGTEAAGEEPVAESAQTKAAPDSVAAQKKVGELPEEPVFDIVTDMGTIRVKLYKNTPKHRDNFARLALSNFYDGTLFHRVINGFMIQGGDPYTKDTLRVDEWGEGGPGYDIPAEFVPEYTHKRGAIAAARRGDLANPMKESSGSQFYLVQSAENCAHLDGEYTVFGETVGGLNVIDRIARTQTDRFDRPVKPVVIQRIRPNAAMNKRALEEGMQTVSVAPGASAGTDSPQDTVKLEGTSRKTKSGHVITKVKK